jgi:hypothetical protein
MFVVEALEHFTIIKIVEVLQLSLPEQRTSFLPRIQSAHKRDTRLGQRSQEPQTGGFGGNRQLRAPSVLESVMVPEEANVGPKVHNDLT